MVGCPKYEAFHIALTIIRFCPKNTGIWLISFYVTSIKKKKNPLWTYICCMFSIFLTWHNFYFDQGSMKHKLSLILLHVCWLEEIFHRVDSVFIHFQSSLPSTVHMLLLLGLQDMVTSWPELVSAAVFDYCGDEEYSWKPFLVLDGSNNFTPRRSDC